MTLEKALFFMLLDRYLNRTATIDEQQQLISFFNSFQHEQDLHMQLGDLHKLEDQMLRRLNERLFGRK